MNQQEDTQSSNVADRVKEAWEKPAIESFAPVSSAEGISYTPSDGISNLTT